MRKGTVPCRSLFFVGDVFYEKDEGGCFIKMSEESIKYLRRYVNITAKIKEAIEKHAQEKGLEPEICAYYEDMDDFYLDWISLCGYTKTIAKKLLDKGLKTGEFMYLPDGQGIVRFVM